MTKSELYFSVDVETNGPLPAFNSMLSLAAVAVDLETRKFVGEFSANLKTVPGTWEDSNTMEFWNHNSEAYLATRQNTVQPLEATMTFKKWVESYDRIPVFVGFPSTFDFMWVYHYLITFTNSYPFSHAALDIKTLAMIAMKISYRKTVKRRMPKSWFHPELKHTHIALDDAKEQAYLFIKIMEVLDTFSPSLSPLAKEARKPPSPETLVGALQDTVHKDVGNSRPAKTNKEKL